MNGDDWDNFRLGLGYGTSKDHQGENLRIAGDTAAVANAYLQQCIQYHEFVTTQATTSQTIEFVAAKSMAQENNEQDSSSVEPVLEETTRSVITSSEFSVQRNREVEEGRVRAQSILKRLQEQTEVNGPEHGSDSPFRQQRDIGFQREAKRQRIALLANLEYIARKEGERARALASKIDEAKELELLTQERYDEILRMRQQNRSLAQLNSTAGIGTEKRKKTEEKKRSRSTRNDYKTLALYVSGLPIDETQLDEAYLLNLFGCYGVVQKIHFYRDKSSGSLKGDGLIIYRVDIGSDSCTLSEAVCTQMNGAELPGGNVLYLQPANTNKEQESQAPKGGQPHSQPEISKQGNESVEPDLDDFFASL